MQLATANLWAAWIGIFFGLASGTLQGRLFHREDWRVNACFVVGLDGHPTVFDALLDFVAEAQPFDVQVTVHTPFPGTPFHARLKSQGRLLSDGAWERCTSFDVNFRPQGTAPEELRAGLKRMVIALYSVEASRKRRAHFRKHARSYTRRVAA